MFVTLGQQSLGAFVLHVYGILLIANMPLLHADQFWTNTLVQVTLIVTIAALLNGAQRLPRRRATMSVAGSCAVRRNRVSAEIMIPG